MVPLDHLGELAHQIRGALGLQEHQCLPVRLVGMHTDILGVEHDPHEPGLIDLEEPGVLSYGGESRKVPEIIVVVDDVAKGTDRIIGMVRGEERRIAVLQGTDEERLAH